MSDAYRSRRLPCVREGTREREREREREGEGEGERGGGGKSNHRVAYFTFCWRSCRTQFVLVHAECWQKVWWFRGERQDQGPRSRVTSFVLFARRGGGWGGCGCGCGCGGTVRSVCVPGHLLTREDLVPNLWFRSSPDAPWLRSFAFHQLASSSPEVFR